MLTKSTMFRAKRILACLLGRRTVLLEHFSVQVTEGRRIKIKEIKFFQTWYRLSALGVVIAPFLVPEIPMFLCAGIAGCGLVSMINGVLTGYRVSDFEKHTAAWRDDEDSRWQILGVWASYFPELENFMIANGICGVCSRFEFELMDHWVAQQSQK